MHSCVCVCVCVLKKESKIIYSHISHKRDWNSHYRWKKEKISFTAIFFISSWAKTRNAKKTLPISCLIWWTCRWSVNSRLSIPIYKFTRTFFEPRNRQSITIQSGIGWMAINTENCEMIVAHSNSNFIDAPQFQVIISSTYVALEESLRNRTNKRKTLPFRDPESVCPWNMDRKQEKKTFDFIECYEDVTIF